MRYTILILLLISMSCNTSNTSKSLDDVISTGNLEELKAKKVEIMKSYQAISNDLDRLETAITLKDDSKKFPLVTTYVIKDTLFKHYIDIQGNVETDQNLLIYPEYQGVLSRVYVKEGDHVTKGQVLAKIDDGGLSSQLSQLQTQYQLAKTTFERQQRLWKQNIGSEIQYLQAKSNMEASQSAVNQTQAQINRTTVKAPFSGRIDAIITDQGQVVAPGAVALMRIVSLNNMYIKASIPENYIRNINKGTEVNVHFPALNKTLSSTVKTVGNFINPNNRTFEITVSIDNANKTIKPNLVAKLELNDYTMANAKLIPSNVIQENAKGETYVFVIQKLNENDAQVKRMAITTGEEYKGLVEVLSGLNDGDIIVKDGALSLLDGSNVTIKQ